MDLVILMIRALFFYFLIMLAMHLLFKSKKVSLADLLIAFIIAQLSIIGIDRPSEPLSMILLPIGLMLALHQLFGPIFRTQGASDQNEKQTETTKNRNQRETTSAPSSSVSPLRTAAADIEMAEMESVVTQYPIGPLPLLLILDGRVFDENLQQIGQTRFWLKNEVQKFGARRFNEVAYCSMDSHGRVFLDKKN
ncbi:hypothetical protein BEP19_05725 [Ammoniphilus oxalaticus]|uniref:YetF C-terminal domain-containing protein n=1 Tax=Ammoniphilus oxalaticus TaxID=66863 RepID=A0A419SIR2_9BACL|nr:YetF domain-containing protein [Ammoniphilus oxalaticus]RKD23924.1 hypothetical protein BEP19_05725 [Ammoniphilus oxalaticus]